MKNIEIKKFWTKLMVASKSVNKIPYEYLKYAQNLRIYDGGIWPRLWFKNIYQTNDWTNQWGFSLNGFLYQIEGGKVWKLNVTAGTREEIADVGYDARADVLVYENTRGTFQVEGTQTINWDSSNNGTVNYWHNQNNNVLIGSLYQSYAWGGLNYDELLTTDITGFALPAIKLLQTGTTTFIKSWSNVTELSDWFVLTEWQYVLGITRDAEGNIDNTSWTFDIEIGRYITTQVAIIASDEKNLKIFDWETISTITIENSWIIEYTAGRSWLASANVLKASRPITLLNPERAYDFTGDGSYQIIYDSTIWGIKATLSWLYVFTQRKVEYIANGNTTSWFSIPLWEGWNPINNLCIVSAGEKIFYITKKLEIETVNYVSGINDAQVGKLSSQKLVNIREYLQNIDTNQPTAFAFNNKNENTVQFFLREIWADFNNICIVYDLVNDTWNIDKGRYFSYVAENDDIYYGYSDISGTIYQDYIGFTDNWTPITTKGVTQAMGWNTPNQKLFWGFNIAGGISNLSTLDFMADIDEQEVFRDTLQLETSLSGWLGSRALWEVEIWGESVQDERKPFVKQADEGRIWLYGDRIQMSFGSDNDIQDWLLDTLWIRFETVNNINIDNKF